MYRCILLLIAMDMLTTYAVNVHPELFHRKCLFMCRCKQVNNVDRLMGVVIFKDYNQNYFKLSIKNALHIFSEKTRGVY